MTIRKRDTAARGPAKYPNNARVKPPLVPVRGKKPKKIKNDDGDEKFTAANSVSFEKLFRNAVKSDSKYVRYVSVTSLKKLPSPLSGYESRTITVDEKKQARRYHHFVIARDGLPVTKSKAVKVSCTCKRFLYYYEYVLSQKGAADIIYSNGDPALSTNPSGYLGVCKHLLAVFTKIAKVSMKK